MKKRYNKYNLSRRELLKMLGVGSTALAFGGLPRLARAQDVAQINEFIAEAAQPYSGAEVNYLAINSSQTKDIEPYLAEFEELTGIRVNPEYGGENEVLSKLELELTSGTGAYDVLHVFSQTITRYLLAGWLAPLTPFIEDSGMTNQELWMPDDFYGSTISQLSGTDGQLYAVPLFIATQIMYYRKDIFADNGITEIPQTFDELWQVCETIHGNPLDAIALRGTRGPTMNVWNWTAWLYGFGGDYFKSYDPTSPDFMVPMLDDPVVIEAADYYARVIQNFSAEDAPAWGWQEASRAFKQGQAAMIQEGSPFGAQFMDPEQSDVADEEILGTFLIPEGPAGRSAPSASHGWSIPAGSRNKEAAWLFIQWATSPALWYRTSIEQPRAMVPRPSVWAQDAYQEKYGWGTYIETVDGAFNAAAEWDRYIPAIPEWTDVGGEISRFLQEVIAGQQSAEEAMTEANALVFEIMEGAGYYG